MSVRMDWIAFPIFLAASGAAADPGVLFPPGDWYRRLDKPSWTPPNRLFPIAWTALYIAMSVAAARIVGSGAPDAGLAVAFWSLQITLNAIWTPVFFGLRRIDLGLAIIALLWIAVAATLAAFLAIDAVAGWLLAPYLVWVSYAGALNFSIWRRNGMRGAQTQRAA